MVIFNITSADIKTKSADVILKIIITDQASKCFDLKTLSFLEHLNFYAKFLNGILQVKAFLDLRC